MKILHRSRKNRWIAGLCGGWGETYGYDPKVVRIVFFLFTILTIWAVFLPSILTYIFAWCTVPKAPPDTP